MTVFKEGNMYGGGGHGGVSKRKDVWVFGIRKVRVGRIRSCIMFVEEIDYKKQRCERLA